jgi:hypothetical protein
LLVFYLTSKNIEDFYFYDKDKNQHNNSYFSFNFYNNNNKNYIRSVNVPNALLNLEHFESSEYTDNTCFTTNYLDSIFTSPLSSQVVSMDSMQNLNSYIKSSIGKTIL